MKELGASVMKLENVLGKLQNKKVVFSRLCEFVFDFCCPFSLVLAFFMQPFVP